MLEAIVGQDFLPKGSGIVTRCPIVLQLFNTGFHKPLKDRNEVSIVRNEPIKSESPIGDKTNLDSWAELLEGDKLVRKLTDFKELRTELWRRSNELAGKDGVCNLKYTFVL